MSNWKCTAWTGEYQVWRRALGPHRSQVFIRCDSGRYAYTSYDHDWVYHPIPHVSSIEEAQQVVDVLLRLGE